MDTLLEVPCLLVKPVGDVRESAGLPTWIPTPELGFFDAGQKETAMQLRTNGPFFEEDNVSDTKPSARITIQAEISFQFSQAVHLLVPAARTMGSVRAPRYV